MKNKLSKFTIALALAASISACTKFEEINTDPTAANSEQVQVEYFLNNAIIGAQQDPDVAERSFVLYWKTAGRQHMYNGLNVGSYNADWTHAYWSLSSNWQDHVNTAIQIAEEKAENGTAKAYNNNLMQIARIWRAYLMSEMSDIFGPIPTQAFQGSNPDFDSTQDVYHFLLDELKDAVAKIDESVANADDKLQKLDPAYAYNWEKWVRYGNSMRLRLAMRIAEVDPGKAKTEFEDAAKGKLITEADHVFQVAELAGWSNLSGVMSREWNGQVISATLNNLYLGLGGVRSEEMLPASLHSNIKPDNYMGLRLLDHYSTKTNDPSAGFFFDGLPHSIDPRAYETFFIPGDFDRTNKKGNTVWSNYPSYSAEPSVTKVKLAKNDASNKDVDLDTKYTWSTMANGDFGAKGTNNPIREIQVGKIPALAHEYRTSANKRIFFANWETYFLLAEAAVKGWSVGTSAQAAYENGIRANFEHIGVTEYLSAYLNSQAYNRVGTSVQFTHTTEPSSSYSMEYVDGYTSAKGTVTVKYPENTIYKNGSVKNDALTKIITQKFIANTPWLPLETWSDHRRLGLPFFENPAVENPLTNLPDLSSSNYMKNQVSFFPQRIRYPATFRNADKKGYAQAVGHLGGPDEVLTPLWWAKQN